MKIKGIDFPDNLRADTMDQVKSIVKRFETDGCLDKLDTVALNTFARDLDLFLQFDELLKGTESEGYLTMSDRGNFSTSPYFDMRNKMERQMFAIMKEFGLTMVSRNKIKGPQEGTEESDLISEYQNDFCDS